METKMKTFIPACMAIALIVALALAFACPQEAMAKVNPWGSGTSYNENTKTLTVKSGKRTIKTLSKTYKGKYYYFEKLVIKGGTTKLNVESGYLRSLKVSKGKLTSSKPVMISDYMSVSGGTVSIASSKRYTNALYVMDDLTVTGGKVTAKSTKEGGPALYVAGDMRLKKGSVTAITKGKGSNGLTVSGFLKVNSGALKVSTSGKSSTAIHVYGDITMSKGTINASANRGKAIQCYDLLKVTGGKVSAKAANGEMAIYSGEAPNVKPSCLGSIRGILCEGMKFMKNGVTYRVSSNFKLEVEVVKGKTSAASVSFGGVTYDIAPKLAAESKLAAVSIA